MTIFDIHPHVVSADRERYPRDPIGGKASPWVASRPVSTAGLLAEMDGAGIAKAVLVQASTAYGYDNRYAADSAAAHPGRFASVACVDVRAPDAPARLRHWIRERGMSGLRIFTSGSKDADDSAWLDDPATFPAWAAAAELGIPIAIQMKARGYERLETLLRRFPGVPVVLDHFAHPPSTDGPPYAAAARFWALAASPQVYLKLTARNVEELADGAGSVNSFLQRCVEEFGARRIAWGSNYPASPGSLADLLALAQRATAFLTTADRDAIFHDTALALYPALGARAVPRG
jgi:predicted TIM-barrel fold metal-dependent hydrolase